MSNETAKLARITLTALIVMLGLIISSYIAINGFIKARGNIKGNENMITVKGSAKKQIKSDFIVWNSSFSVTSPTLVSAYQALSSQKAKVNDYLLKQGVRDSELVFQSVTTMPNYKIYTRPGTSETYTSNEIESYTLEQQVEIKSNNVDTITQIARKSTELINSGVAFRSSPPQYFYTKIADVKVSMLAEATKDAKNRAVQIAQNTGSTCGRLRSADMGIFQITPIYSNEVSDYGMNDTTSLEKEIMSVVTCRFDIK
jgi:hypothetical protein